jgi:hypothetical protein
MKIWECIILLSGLLRSAPIGTSPKRQFKAASSGPVLAKSKHNARGIRKMASSIRPHIDLSPQLVFYQKMANLAQGTIGNSVRPQSPPPELDYGHHTQRLKLPTGMHLYHPRNNDHAKLHGSDQFSNYDDSDIIYSEEVNHFQRKFEELKSYISAGRMMRAVSMLDIFDGGEKNIILKYAFLEEQWDLTRRMLERGFDPSEIIKILNDLPASEAIEKVDKIGYYGIFKDGNGFEYKPMKNDVSTPLKLVKFDKFRFLRSISPDLARARSQIHPNFFRILPLFYTQGFKAGDQELSKLDESQKAIALAMMVEMKSGNTAKQMISHGYSQKVLKNLLDQYPDRAAIQVYDGLKPFDQISPSDLHKLLNF